MLITKYPGARISSTYAIRPRLDSVRVIPADSVRVIPARLRPSHLGSTLPESSRLVSIRVSLHLSIFVDSPHVPYLLAQAQSTHQLPPPPNQYNHCVTRLGQHATSVLCIQHTASPDAVCCWRLYPQLSAINYRLRPRRITHARQHDDALRNAANVGDVM